MSCCGIKLARLVFAIAGGLWIATRAEALEITTVEVGANPGCASPILRPAKNPLTLASAVGGLRGDACRHQDGCCGPIGSGDASRPPARDSFRTSPTRRPRSFE
jgi:hypothetical protein